MILDIIKIDNPDHLAVLRTISSDVTVFDQDFRDFCTNLVDTMYAADGAGLSAPQVGVNKNVFVMRTLAGLQNNTREHFVLVNPYDSKRIWHSDYRQIKDIEGCLSIPGLQGRIERSNHVYCTYWDVEGNRHLGHHFIDLEARIYQHEKDHLNGVLFIDRTADIFQKDFMHNEYQ